MEEAEHALALGELDQALAADRTRVGNLTPEVRMAKRVWGLSKQKANYRPAPEPGVRCDRCTYMFPPLGLGGCRLVRGLIQASATCDEFTPQHNSGA